VPATSRPGAYPGTQAVQRAVCLLKAFTAERPALRLPDLSAVAGLNKTTTYRLLSALVTEGLLERSAESGEYRLGPALRAIARRGRH
jgi:IclR family acetate operon transcriptional repressor